jgi:flagellar motor switch/type III secretory pathway protein FliN
MALVHVLRPPPPPLTLRGAFPVNLPLVVGVCTALPSELSKLSVGDAWSCGDGWWIDTQPAGTGVLVSPGGETGFVVDLASDGSIVVRGETRHVPIEEASGAMDETTELTDAVTDAVAHTPVVVRVELGSVSLLAREWSEIRAGDVIRTDQRVGEPVRLRIGGREVARGELVDVEGELGVKITDLATEEGE